MREMKEKREVASDENLGEMLCKRHEKKWSTERKSRTSKNAEMQNTELKTANKKKI